MKLKHAREARVKVKQWYKRSKIKVKQSMGYVREAGESSSSGGFNKYRRMGYQMKGYEEGNSMIMVNGTENDGMWY